MSAAPEAVTEGMAAERSSVQIDMDSKGLAKIRVKVYAGQDSAELASLVHGRQHLPDHEGSRRIMITTVRDLIIELLQAPMDAEVTVYTPAFMEAESDSAIAAVSIKPSPFATGGAYVEIKPSPFATGGAYVEIELP